MVLKGYYGLQYFSGGEKRAPLTVTCSTPGIGADRDGMEEGRVRNVLDDGLAPPGDEIGDESATEERVRAFAETAVDEGPRGLTGFAVEIERDPEGREA